jgi:hypothetical protein
MKRIYRAYNIKEESDEENEDKLIQDDYVAIESESFEVPPTNCNEETSPNFWQSLSLPSKILFGLAILWPIVFALINYLFPNVIEPIKNASSPKVLFILPICVVAALNGLVILLQQNTVEETEEKRMGMIGYLVGILFVLLGCGLGAYLIMVDLIGVGL